MNNLHLRDFAESQVSFWLTLSEGGFIDMCVNNLNINLFVILLIPPLVTGRTLEHSTLYTVMVMLSGSLRKFSGGVMEEIRRKG